MSASDYTCCRDSGSEYGGHRWAAAAPYWVDAGDTDLDDHTVTRVPPPGSDAELLTVWEHLRRPALRSGHRPRHEVEQVYSVAEPYLPDESRGQGNIYERLRGMYEGLATLLGPIRGRAKALIQKMGTHSDHPLILAQLLADLCDELLVSSPSSGAS